MSPTTTGPCGFTLSAIIGYADRFARTMATFGITEPEQLKLFCTWFGETLTETYLRLGVAQDLRSYEDRLADLMGPAVDALKETGLWQTCGDLGPYEGAPLEAGGVGRAIEMTILAYETIQHRLGVSAAEALDLLAWKQTVLAVPLLFEEEPNLADRPGHRRPA